MSIGVHEPQRPFLEVKDLTRTVRDRRRHRSGGHRLVVLASRRARRSASSASPAPARASPRWPCSGLHRSRSNAKVTGEIWLDDEELVTATDEQVRKLRGGKMAMIFQDPLSAMHPYFTVGSQIVEAYRVHHPA